MEKNLYLSLNKIISFQKEEFYLEFFINLLILKIILLEEIEKIKYLL